ncbi:MAG: ATP-binding protein [Pontibacterium sp.]
MILHKLKQTTIRQQVLIVTLMPLLLITLILGSYFINTELKTAEDALFERGQTMSHLMASAAEFGILTSDKTMLQSLMRRPGKETDVADIVFLDRAFNVVVRANPEGSDIPQDEAYPYPMEESILFLQPVITSGIDVQDSPEFPSDTLDKDIIGWVAILLSRIPTLRRQQEIISNGITIAIIGFLITLFIAARVGRSITRPVQSLTQVVKLLEKGHMDARSTLRASGELNTLSRGINRLAFRVQESNSNLENKVESATTRLSAALVHMELQNEALKLAREKADEANLAKDDFLARMSHELRTPLTSVLGFAELLNQTTLKSEQKEYTRIINLTSSLLLSIIDDILDFSKLQSDAIELEQIRFDLESLIYDIVEMQVPAAQTKGLQIIPVIEPDVPDCLTGDPTRIRQILTNLISNAIKFTPEGHVIISVRISEQLTDKTTLLFEIKDTGIGIAQNRINNLFQAFTQADSSITRKFGGSGLGLMIAKLLAELMDGSIELQSEEKRGTVVRVRIPFNLPKQKQRACVTQPNTATTVLFDRHPSCRLSLKYLLHPVLPEPLITSTFDEMSKAVSDPDVSTIIWGLCPGEALEEAFVSQLNTLTSRFKGRLILLPAEPLTVTLPDEVVVLHKPARTTALTEALLSGQHPLPAEMKAGRTPPKIPVRILVAEDNDYNRLLIDRILTQAGADVATTTNGEEVLTRATTEVFDLIVLDVHMPKLDGIQAASAIRKHNSDIPIIALTANVITSEHQKLLRAGVNKILFKPIDDQALKNSILSLTNQSEAKNKKTIKHKTPVQPKDYGVSQDALHLELDKQLKGIFQAYQQQNTHKMRDGTHQLLGLAGLYELPELEVAVRELNNAVEEEHARLTWQSLSRLKRIIKHNQY